ncbi:hypothetical protein D0866_09981 [Hortaea werneckii]|uniref:Uncharacterized protein n=1 Tax=Hortaea werneckii TaxID=91943 RepID=A0A3M7AJR1_HORWE|nr:hypothetical protein D0866_09981 [Hortaea werneckii]
MNWTRTSVLLHMMFMCTMMTSASHAECVHGMFRVNLKSPYYTISYLESNSEWTDWAIWGAGPLLGPAYIEKIEPGEGTLVESVCQYAFVLTTGQAWSSIQCGSSFLSRTLNRPTISSVLASPTGDKRFE